MDFEERRRIEERFRSLDDGALRHLVALEQNEYRPEAFEIAAGELTRRHLPKLSPEEYWQQSPEEWLAHAGFCYSCWAATTAEGPGGTITVDFIGTRLLGSEDPCPTCKSAVATKWFCLIVPLIRLESYRLLPDRSRGRRLRSADDTATGPE